MNVKFAQYDPATGRIGFVADLPESMIELQDGSIYVGDADPKLDYIVGGQCVPRPQSPVGVPRTTVKADGADELVLTGVPAGAQLRVTGPTPMTGAVDQAGDVTLTFALAGEYRLAVDAFPFLSLEVAINAV